jgi:hypothetical protein
MFAIRDFDVIIRIIPVLTTVRRTNGVRYTIGGIADDILNILLKVDDHVLASASALAHIIVPRWQWCIACILRFTRGPFMKWKAVWTAHTFINDEHHSIPVWAHMVPPHGNDARPGRLQKDIEEFYDNAPILGGDANDEGLTTSAIKLRSKVWAEEGASTLACLLLQYGIPMPLLEQPRPFFLEPYGNYKELHTDKELNEAFQRGHQKMAEWNILIQGLTFRPTQVMPQFYLFQEKDDGSIKERGIQDCEATGLNAIMAWLPCVLAGLDDIHDSLQEDEFVALRDLTNAFWHYLTSPRFLLLMGIKEPNGKTYAIALSIMMGQQFSPSFAQFFAVEVTRMLMKRGLRRAMPYIDDFTLFGSPLIQLAVRTAEEFDKLTDRLELEVAAHKSSNMLREGTVSLGIATDTTKGGRAYASDGRIDRILRLVNLAIEAIDHGTAYLPLGFLLMVAGKLQHVSRYVWSLVAHMRPFYEGTVDFAHAEDEDCDWSAPNQDRSRFGKKPPTHLLRAIVTSNYLEAAGDPETLQEHPILSFWWDKKYVKNASDMYNATFPVAVTRRLVNSLHFARDNLKVRNGIPLFLDKPAPTRGRFRPARVDVHHEHIDVHSATPLGIPVISSDAATHGDIDDIPRIGFWYGSAERIVYKVYNPIDDKAYQINWLEALGALKALQDLVNKLNDSRVALRIDNYSVVCCINKGMCKNDDIQAIITEIWELSWQHKTSICAIWVCTKCNHRADAISRGTMKATSCDFMFSKKEFQVLVANELQGDIPTLDGFANNDGDNALCGRFCSPNNSFFKSDLRGIHVWINADFLQILDALEYWLETKAKCPIGTRATVLVPHYDGNEPWRRILTKRFRRIKTYPAGEKLFFTLPASNEIRPGQDLLAKRERLCIGSTRWPVEIWHCN